MALGASTACASTESDPQAGTPERATTTTSVPAAAAATTTESVPDGTESCGEVNLLSGWPTTLAPDPRSFDCLVGAFDAGTPAVLTVVEGDPTGPSDAEHPPPRITVTYTVVGPHRVRVQTVAARTPEPVVEVCGELTNELANLDAAACERA